MDRMSIRIAILKSGKTHRELAEELKVHPTTLSRFLNERTMLGAEALVKLLAILNLNAKSLVKDAA